MPPGFDHLQYASTGEDHGNEDLNCIDKRIILCKEGSSETTLSGFDSGSHPTITLSILQGLE